MKKHIIEFFWNTLLVFAGSALCALGVRGVLVQQELLTGGLTGLSLAIFYHFPSLPLGVIYWALNVPVFIAGWRLVGTRFVLFSAWGMTLYASLLNFMPVRLAINDPLLSVIVAGALSGAGLALILSSYGSAGGSDILLVIMNRMLGMPVGTAGLIIDGAVLVLLAQFFPLEKVLYTAVYISVSTIVLNKVFHGFSRRQAIMIISNQWEEVADMITHDPCARITLIKGQGRHHGNDKMIIYLVVKRSMVPAVKRLVFKSDPRAFLSVMEAVDVAGTKISNQPSW